MQMIDLMKRLAELDAKNPNVVKQPVSEVSVDYVANKVAGAMRSPDPKLGWPRAAQTLDKMSSKFGSNQSNLAVQRSSEKMTADKAILKYLDALQSGEMENAFWDLPPAYQQSVSFLQHFADALDAEGMEAHADDVRDGLRTAQRRQGVAEGSQGDYTFTTALNGMLGDDKEFEVTYHYDKGADAVTHGSLPSDGRPADVEIISVKDLETGQDVSINTVGKNIWAEFEEEAWYDYRENHQHDNFQDPEYDRDDRYESLAECGMMGSGMSQPRSPASINMTAASGEELSGMLRDIMSLAGVKPVTPHDLGHEHDPSVMSTVPGMGVASAEPEAEPLDMKDMIAKIDSMNSDDDEEEIKTDETISSMPDPQMVPVPPGTHDPAGSPGAGKGRGLKNHPVATPQDAFESLMADYRNFVAESEQSVAEGSRTAKPGEHTPLNSTKRKEDAAAQSEKMKKAAAAEPGKELLKKIDNKK